MKALLVSEAGHLKDQPALEARKTPYVPGLLRAIESLGRLPAAREFIKSAKAIDSSLNPCWDTHSKIQRLNREISTLSAEITKANANIQRLNEKPQKRKAEWEENKKKALGHATALETHNIAALDKVKQLLVVECKKESPAAVGVSEIKDLHSHAYDQLWKDADAKVQKTLEKYAASWPTELKKGMVFKTIGSLGTRGLSGHGYEIEITELGAPNRPHKIKWLKSPWQAGFSDNTVPVDILTPKNYKYLRA